MAEARRAKVLHRRSIVARLVADRKDQVLAIAGLGNPCWDLMAAGDNALNFYNLGAMGSAAALGLGLALARPERRTLVITGDGELLMGLGTLATIGVEQPRNLTIAVFDNEAYGETGMQATHTAYGIDLSAFARAAGFPRTETIWTETEVEAGVRLAREGEGPVMVVFKIAPEKLGIVSPPRDGAYVKARFRQALLAQ